MVNGKKKLEEVHQYSYYIDVLKTINVKRSQLMCYDTFTYLNPCRRVVP